MTPLPAGHRSLFRRRRAESSRRLAFESLEPRRLLAVLAVNPTPDDLDPAVALATLQPAGTDSAAVTLATNTRPVLVVALDQQVNEGAVLDLSGLGAPPLGLFIDDDLLDEHTATIDWGDGSPADVVDNSEISFANGSGAFGGTHTYADDGVYAVNVTVRDEGGLSDMRSFTVTVHNVAPVVTPPQNQTVEFGTELKLPDMNLRPAAATFVDPGTADTFTAQIDWGDGTIDEGQVVRSGDSWNVEGMHLYTEPGTYRVNVRVADDDMSGNFAGGVAGIDFVAASFDARVMQPPLIDLNGDEPGVDLEIVALRRTVVSIGALGRTRIADADSITLSQLEISVPLAASGTVVVDPAVAAAFGIRVVGQDTAQLFLQAISSGTTLADFQAVLQSLRYVGTSAASSTGAVDQVVITVVATDTDRLSGTARAIINFVDAFFDLPAQPDDEAEPLVLNRINTGVAQSAAGRAASGETAGLANDGSGSAGMVLNPDEGFAALGGLLEAERALQRAMTNPQSADNNDVVDAVFSLGDVELVSLLGIDMGDEPVHQQANKEPIREPLADSPPPQVAERDQPEPSPVPDVESDAPSLKLWGALAGSGMLWLGGAWWWIDRRRRRAQNKGL